MNAIDYIFTTIIGVAVYHYADMIVDYIKYLPVLRFARDSQNPISIKIIGILISLYGLGMAIYTVLPRS